MRVNSRSRLDCRCHEWHQPRSGAARERDPQKAERHTQPTLRLRVESAHGLCGPSQERTPLSSDSFYAQGRKFVREMFDGSSGNKAGPLRWRFASATFLGSSGFLFNAPKKPNNCTKTDQLIRVWRCAGVFWAGCTTTVQQCGGRNQRTARRFKRTNLPRLQRPFSLVWRASLTS
jgi:hypothetical protein